MTFSAHTRLCSHSEVYSECFFCLVVCLGAFAGSLECLECTFVRVLRAGAPFSQPLRCAALSGFFFAVCSCPAFIVFTVLFYCFVLLFFCCVRVFWGFLSLRFQRLIVPGLTAPGSCIVASPHPCFVGWSILQLVACLFRWLINIVCWSHLSLVLGFGSGASYRDCWRTGSGASYLVRLSPRPRR